MDKLLTIKWFYALSVLFIVLNGILIYHEIYFLPAVPAFFIILLASLFSIDKLFLFIAFCTPLSFGLEGLALGGIGFSFPAEPLMFGLMLVFWMKQLFSSSIEKRFLKHPVTLIILVNLAWIIITTLTSQEPLISFKYLLARLWFITVFYFLAVRVFKSIKNINLFLWLMLIPMTLVCIYTVVNHAQYFFDEETAHWVMWPFYKDHTIYGAAIAFLIPVAFYFVLKKELSITFRSIAVFCLIVLGVGMFFSYTRAAWLSLLGSLGVFFLMFLRVKFKYVAILGIFLIGAFINYQEQIFIDLERNRQDSSDDLSEHIESISNISTDASNLERINLWNCALRMFAEKPVFGWGPGAYQFHYGPFQHSSEKTIISEIRGRNVNAHSELLNPLAETGLIGALSFFLLIIYVCFTAIKLYMRIDNQDHKRLILAVFLGLITYYAHGFLNSYIDTDEASVPFWGFTAIIVALDIYHYPKKLEEATSK